MTKTIALITLLASATPALAAIVQEAAPAPYTCTAEYTATLMRRITHLNDDQQEIRKYATQNGYAPNVVADVIHPLQRDALELLELHLSLNRRCPK